jgi:DNA (cytosine-5)-methyltransferase 1
MTHDQNLKKENLNELALFAGAGGGILGGRLLGWRTVCAVEFAAYPREVLLARQRDGILEPFPIWDDVRTFDGGPWRGQVDVVSGGFPCTDISSARSNSNKNGKHSGLDGQASGLWFEMERIVAEVCPQFVFIENSPNLRTRGLARVLKGLAAMGYDARWGCFNALRFGADHERERMFIVAHANGAQLKGGGVSCGVSQANPDACRSNWWQDKPGLERVANGMANQMDRLKAVGNGQVPAVVKLAWETLKP